MLDGLYPYAFDMTQTDGSPASLKSARMMMNGGLVKRRRRFLTAAQLRLVSQHCRVPRFQDSNRPCPVCGHGKPPREAHAAAGLGIVVVQIVSAGLKIDDGPAGLLFSD